MQLPRWTVAFITYHHDYSVFHHLNICYCYCCAYVCKAPSMPICFCFIKPQLVIARAASCNGHVHLFVCLFVCLSPNCKNMIISKTKQFRAIDDLWEVVHGLFKEPIIGPLKSKMAEIRHLENRHDIIFFCWGWSDLDKILQTDAEWHVDCGDVVKWSNWNQM